MKFFIVGGTEKAGTTALFSFFYNHPQINPSINKETDFFRRSSALSLDSYISEFSERGGETYFEASPGYLAASDFVIHNMQNILKDQDPRVLFILRDPVDRLLSSFNFHKSRGYIGEFVDFGVYLDAAFDYRDKREKITGISEWALESVFHGEYATHIERYLRCFGAAVMIIDYDTLKNSPQDVVQEICATAGIDGSYFNDFRYFEANKTFRPKSRFVHTQLIKLNKLLASFFFRYPGVKSYLLGIYKKINKGSSDRISKSERQRAMDFYRDSVCKLVEILSAAGRSAPAWTDRYL